MEEHLVHMVGLRPVTGRAISPWFSKAESIPGLHAVVIGLVARVSNVARPKTVSCSDKLSVCYSSNIHCTVVR